MKLIIAKLLRDSYRSLKKQAAPGVDEVTWKEYGEDLEARLSTCTDESIAELIMPNRRKESGYQNRMEGNDQSG
jgi:hypothetical protein